MAAGHVLPRSIKPPDEAFSPQPDFLPHALSFENYRVIVTYNAGLAIYVGNSLAVAGMTILFCLIPSVPAGYGLARFDFRGKEVLFLILIASMMVPF